MNKSIQMRYVQLFEALVTGIAMCELHNRELYSDISVLRENPGRLLRVLANVWSLVDDIYRIRQLVQSVPGLNVRSPEMRRFLSKTEVVEILRHYIQHLRMELAKPESITTPVWGSFSWIDPLDELTCHTAILGRTSGKVEHYSCVYDRFENKWVSRTAINIKGTTFNIDPVVDEVDRIKVFVLNWLTKQSSDSLSLKVEYPVVTTRAEF